MSTLLVLTSPEGWRGEAVGRGGAGAARWGRGGGVRRQSRARTWAADGATAGRGSRASQGRRGVAARVGGGTRGGGRSRRGGGRRREAVVRGGEGPRRRLGTRRRRSRSARAGWRGGSLGWQRRRAVTGGTAAGGNDNGVGDRVEGKCAIDPSPRVYIARPV